MKKLIILAIIFFKSAAFSQDYTFTLANDFQSLFGVDGNLVSYNPIFKLDKDSIYNKTESSKIKKLPKVRSNNDLAYGFLYFTGNSDSVFENEIVFLVKNYMSEKSILYFDKNGNLDFTDDDAPVMFSKDLRVELKNSKIKAASLHYFISKSMPINDAGQTFKKRIRSLFPNSQLISPDNWITNQRLSIKVTKALLNEKPITIYLFDEDADGLFTSNTDKIFIEPNTVELGKDIFAFSINASLINDNATFLIYGKYYSLKELDEGGKKLIITSSSKDITKVHITGDIISTIKIDLLNGQSLSIEDMLNKGKYTLLEVSDTWCGGCIVQKPIVKAIHESNKARVIGVFANDTEASVSKYIQNYGINWQVGLMNEEFKKMFRINTFPTYILISPKGKIEMIEMQAKKIKEYLNKVK
jgi:thiol-disulfide isomerase/thioredoxin